MMNLREADLTKRTRTTIEEIALVVVDVQNDFANPNGSLYVKGGETIVPIINLWLEKLSDWPVVFTQDWHPAKHSSFKDFGGTWPVHCVQDTWGAEIHKDITVSDKYSIIRKGTALDKDEYSGFENVSLEELLLSNNITRIFVCGLATDYCVFHTVVDGLRAGFDVVLIRQAIKGVNLNDHKEGLHGIATTDSEIAIGRMVQLGAKII